MFTTTEILLYGLTETQRIIKNKIADMQFYYLMPGTKKELNETYGFTKEASDQFIRITKVGWKCFAHDVTPSLSDDQVEIPQMITPPQFGWGVPVNNIPDEVVVVLLEDHVTRCRFIESRTRTYEDIRQAFKQMRNIPSKIEKTSSWGGGSYTVYDTVSEPITRERIDAYLSVCTVADLLFARQFFAESVQAGRLTASDAWGR